MARVKQAAKALVKAVRRLVDTGRRARTAGDAARIAGRWEEAAGHYRAYLRSRPDDFDIWVQMGHAYKESGRLPEAAEAYAGAARLNEWNADLLLSRGHLAKRRGDYAEAAGFYQLSYSIENGTDVVRELLDPAVQRHMIGSPADRPRSATGTIDGLADMVLSGWVPYDGTGDKPEIEVLLDDQVIACDLAFYHRTEPVLNGRTIALGFQIDLSGLLNLADNPILRVRNAATHEGLENSPFLAQMTVAARDWTERHSRMSEADRGLAQTKMAAEVEGLTLSVVMALSGPRCQWLKEAIGSVLNQWCANWEMVLVLDGSTPSDVSALAAEYASSDARIALIENTASQSVAGSINAGLAAATSDYAIIMNRGVILEPEAVYRFLEAAMSGADLIYSDEAATGASPAGVGRLICRPAFSAEYYRSFPYFADTICVRRTFALEIGGLTPDIGAATAVDFVFRAMEAAGTIAHAPALLYRRRSETPAAIADAQPSIRAALEAHLSRIGRTAAVSAGRHAAAHDVCYADDQGRTVIIIPTKDRLDLLKSCIDSLLATTPSESTRIVVIDHKSKEPKTKAYLKAMAGIIDVMPYSGPFNFSLMNNLAAHKFARDAKYILFMNNDVEAISPGWLERMRGMAAQDGIGAVGATLLYANGMIQHSGVVLGEGVPADHAHKKTPYWRGGETCPGRDYVLASNREYSAVTAACMIVPAMHFFGVGGYDEDLAIGFNDTDLCLRLRSLGLLVINVGASPLYHYESATRRITDQIKHPEDGRRFTERWGTFLVQGDPFYNPLLSRDLDHEIADPSNIYKRVRVRPARPGCAPYEQGRPRRVAAALRAP